MRSGILLTIGAFLFLFALSPIALAAEPTTIALQGKLTNTTTGSLIYSATLRVNVSDSNGITVWNQTFPNAVSSGFFDLLLGSDASNPLNLTFNKEYNVSVYIGSSSTPIGGSYKFRSSMGSVSVSNITSGNFSAEGNYSFGSTLFIDKTNGYVGVGTTLPAAMLDVSGSFIFESGTEGVNAIGGSPVTGTYLAFNPTVSGATSIIGFSDRATLTSLGTAARAAKMILGASGGITVNTGGGAVTDVSTLTIFDPSITVSTGTVTNAYSLYIPTAPTEGTNNYALHVASGVSSFGGNVGIGTTAPFSTLHINSSSADGALRVTNVSGTTVFFVNGSSGNVGIGTTNPNRLLSVSDTAAGGQSALAIQAAIDGQSSLYFTDTDTNIGGILYTHSNDQMEFRVNDAARLAINNEGNVGIGTTSPTNKLTISSSAARMLNLSSSPSGSGAGMVIGDIGGHAWELGPGLGMVSNVDDFSFFDQTSAIQPLTLTSSGKAGVNASKNPAQTLTVQGTLNVTPAGLGSTPSIFVNSAGNVGIGTTDPKVLLEVSRGTDNRYHTLIDGANILINDTTGTSQFSIGTAGKATTADDLAIVTNNTARIYVMGTNGNVGIGTTHPGRLLEITGATPYIRLNDTSNNGATDSIDFLMGDVGTTSTLTYAFTNGTSSVSVMTLNEEGNVGIGTTNPAQKLDVEGKVRVGGQGDGMAVINITGSSTGTSMAVISQEAGSATNTGTLSLYSGNPAVLGTLISGGNANSYINGGGNVGIGTSAPSGLLELSSATANAANITLSQRSTAGGEQGGLIWRGYYNGGTTFFDAIAIKRINLGDDNDATNLQRLGIFMHNTSANGPLVERMSVLNNGNVGIGNSTPSGTLHVEKSSGQVNQYLTSGSNAGAIIRIERYNSADNYFTVETGSGNRDTLEINPSSGTGLVMDISGNVGIGKTAYIIATDEKFYVDGKGAFKTTGDTSPQINLWNAATSGDAPHLNFYTGSGADYRGDIHYDFTGGILKFTGQASGTYSDARLKTVIAPSEYGLNTIRSIDTKRFVFKRNNVSDVGVVAQELYEVFPEAVEVGSVGAIDPSNFNSSEVWKVDYSKLVVPLIKAVQEQQQQIESLTSIVCLDHPQASICAI